MKRYLLFHCWFAITIGCNSLLAQTNTVKAQLVDLENHLEPLGFDVTHDIFYSSLSEGQYSNYYLQLESAYEYRIYAVCDGDCGDIDLCLYDGDDDDELDCDRSNDDLPLVEFSPFRTRQFRLWFKMYDCSINPCRFAIVVFGR